MAYTIFRNSEPKVRCGYNTIAFSHAATEAMKDASFVILLWDRETKMIAIQPSDERTNNTYTLIRRKGCRTSHITCVTFLRETGLRDIGNLPIEWNAKASRFEFSIPEPK